MEGRETDGEKDKSRAYAFREKGKKAPDRSWHDTGRTGERSGDHGQISI